MTTGSNLETKVLEIRDAGTFIPMLAVNINPAMDDDGSQRWLMRRCGFPCDGEPNIILTRLDGSGKATNDPYAWGGRTYPVAHNYIIEHWAELSDGDVVDVEYILGEKPTKKVSERLTYPIELPSIQSIATHPVKLNEDEWEVQP